MHQMAYAASAVVEGPTDRRTLENGYAAGFRARPALLVRGRSRRIMTMRCRPANISVITRRDSVSATTDAARVSDRERCMTPPCARAALVRESCHAGLDDRKG